MINRFKFIKTLDRTNYYSVALLLYHLFLFWPPTDPGIWCLCILVIAANSFSAFGGVCCWNKLGKLTLIWILFIWKMIYVRDIGLVILSISSFIIFTVCNRTLIWFFLAGCICVLFWLLYIGHRRIRQTTFIAYPMCGSIRARAFHQLAIKILLIDIIIHWFFQVNHTIGVNFFSFYVCLV